MMFPRYTVDSSSDVQMTMFGVGEHHRLVVHLCVVVSYGEIHRFRRRR